MRKKRYTLYLSPPLAHKFDETATKQAGGKSALVEEALRISLATDQAPSLEDRLALKFNDIMRVAQTIERDVAIVTETLSLFVRYYLTITPPLPTDEQEPARLLGKERFHLFVAQVGRQIATDQRLVSEVLEIIARQHPDLFDTAGVDEPLKTRPSTRSDSTPRPNGRPSNQDTSHD